MIRLQWYRHGCFRSLYGCAPGYSSAIIISGNLGCFASSVQFRDFSSVFMNFTVIRHAFPMIFPWLFHGPFTCNQRTFLFSCFLHDLAMDMVSSYLVQFPFSWEFHARFARTGSLLFHSDLSYIQYCVPNGRDYSSIRVLAKDVVHTGLYKVYDPRVRNY